MKRRLTAYAFILLLSGTAFIQFQLDSRANYFAVRDVFVTLPSAQSLRILSFGYQNLVADMLFLWSIQFYSTYNLRNSYDYIEQIFSTITDITPAYKDPYIVGALIMVYEKRDVEMALRLLDKASRRLPDEWMFDLDAGFYAQKFLRDVDRARFFYERASGKPGAPSFLKRNAAHMLYLKNDLQVAYQIWSEIFREACTDLEKNSSFNHLYQIKSEMDRQFLNGKIERFRAMFGRFPRTLNELSRGGILGAGAIPKDFSGRNYNYDARTGKVSARKEFRWKRYS